MRRGLASDEDEAELEQAKSAAANRTTKIQAVPLQGESREVGWDGAELSKRVMCTRLRAPRASLVSFGAAVKSQSRASRTPFPSRERLDGLATAAPNVSRFA